MRRHQVILFGASNLTRGLGQVVHLLRHQHRVRQPHPAPLDIYVAAGHGRSYGSYSRMLGRGLPGIINCRLWEQLPPAAERWVLFTDMGNDIVYGRPPQEIHSWIRACLERVRCDQLHLVMGGLPRPTLERISPLQFSIARAILFPTRRVQRLQVLGHVQQLQEYLLQTTLEHGGQFITPPLEWYGLDPIHIRRRISLQVWGQKLESWLSEQPLPARVERIPYHPAERSYWGRAQQFSQPRISYPDDDTRVYLY